MTLVADKCLGSEFHNFQRLRGLGGQGAELEILRRWELRRWGGKIPPAGSGGEKVLSSGPVCARPRLPALIPLAPEPRHGGGHRMIGIHAPSSNHSCYPCMLTGQKQDFHHSPIVPTGAPGMRNPKGMNFKPREPLSIR